LKETCRAVVVVGGGVGVVVVASFNNFAIWIQQIKTVKPF